MYSVTVSHHIMIAHSLVGAVFGPAQQLHGATFVVEAELRREALDADGIICDIGRALDLLREGELAPTDAATIHSLRVVLRENPVAWAAYDAALG